MGVAAQPGCSAGVGRRNGAGAGYRPRPRRAAWLIKWYTLGILLVHRPSNAIFWKTEALHQFRPPSSVKPSHLCATFVLPPKSCPVARIPHFFPTFTTPLHNFCLTVLPSALRLYPRQHLDAGASYALPAFPPVVSLRRIKRDGQITPGGQKREPFTSGHRRQIHSDGSDGTSPVL